MPIVEPGFDGTDQPKTPARPAHAQSDAAAASATSNPEAAPVQRRVHPDLLSAARDEERAREAGALQASWRITQAVRAAARSGTVQPTMVQGEEHASSRRRGQASVRAQSSEEFILTVPEAAARDPEQHATVVPTVDQVAAPIEPSGVDQRNSGGGLRRGSERAGQPTPLKAGERWKRRLPLACR